MPFIIPANTLASGSYDVDNSCRFETNTYMTKTASSGNTKTFTISFWTKRSALGSVPSGSNQFPISFYQDGDNRISFAFLSGNTFIVYAAVGGADKMNFTTDRVFRDTSAWYHVVIKVDTTQGTEANRFKMYINGVEETSFSTETYPDRNQDLIINTDIYIGVYDTNNNFFHGYLSEFVYIDGTALAPTSFGEFDEDSVIWKPIDVSGLTFGTNGFYLDFKASGNLGNDANGGTDLGETNLTAVDQSTDTCTNNFSTINALDNFYFGGTLSEGNVKVLSIAGVESYITNTIPVATGKWYWEIKITASGSGKEFVGIVDKVSTNTNFTPYSGNTQAISYYGNNGHAKAGSGSSNSSYGDTFGAGDIIGVAMDLDNNKLYFSKNGTFQDSGDPTSGSTGTGALAIPATPHDGVYYAQFANIHNTASTFEANFGNPSFTGTDQADGNGFGSFEYAVPSGYFALCTKNLSEFG